MLCISFPEGKSDTFKHIKLLSLSRFIFSYSPNPFLPFRFKSHTWDNVFHKHLWAFKKLSVPLITFRGSASPWLLSLGRPLRCFPHDFWCLPTPSHVSKLIAKVGHPLSPMKSLLKTPMSTMNLRSNNPAFCIHSSTCYKLCSHVPTPQTPFLTTQRPLFSASVIPFSSNLPNLRRSTNTSKAPVRRFIESLLANMRSVWCFGCGCASLPLSLKGEVFAIDITAFNAKCVMHNINASSHLPNVSFVRAPCEAFPIIQRLPNAICFECGIPSMLAWRLTYCHLKLNGLSVVLFVTLASLSRVVALSSVYGGRVWHILLSSTCVRINSRLYRYRSSVLVWVVRKQIHNAW